MTEDRLLDVLRGWAIYDQGNGPMPFTEPSDMRAVINASEELSLRGLLHYTDGIYRLTPKGQARLLDGKVHP